MKIYFDLIWKKIQSFILQTILGNASQRYLTHQASSECPQYPSGQISLSATGFPIWDRFPYPGQISLFWDNFPIQDRFPYLGQISLSMTDFPIWDRFHCSGQHFPIREDFSMRDRFPIIQTSNAWQKLLITTAMVVNGSTEKKELGWHVLSIS